MGIRNRAIIESKAIVKKSPLFLIKGMRKHVYGTSSRTGPDNISNVSIQGTLFSLL
jgi:hypothetical protein